MTYSGTARRFVEPLTLLVVLIFFSSCDSSGTDAGSGDWLIPREEVVDGGPGKDGIPSIDRPRFAPARETTYADDDRRIIGIRVGDDIRAYPHQVMDWHEIVNDRVGNLPIAVTFCPLTGTGVAFNREIAGVETTFGVSGLLFRNNLIPYDRQTDSRWSQLQLRSVEGINSGLPTENIQVLETTWGTWKAMYPDSEVLTTDTGFSRNYQSFAYGPGYLTNSNQILFPVRNPDGRLQAKDRVFTLIPEEGPESSTPPRAYPLASFGNTVSVIVDEFEGRDIIVAGSRSADLVVAFERRLADGRLLSFEPVSNRLPVILQDDSGTQWDVFGNAVSGLLAGQRLQPVKGITGYWFGFADMYPDIEIAP